MTTWGKLYIVATPIGNLGDITLRALETLKQADLIAAEDTRHSKKLLAHYGINTPTISLHNYNETKRCNLLIKKLQHGKNITLISDAGTPLISGPGYRLVTAIQEQGGIVTPIPGACAAIAALSVAGLPTDKFVFEGFLPAKSSAQVKRLQELSHESRTMIFYISPHHLLETINNMQNVFGINRLAVLAKELTKTFETIYKAPLAEIINYLNHDPKRQQGEFVILVTGQKQIKLINQELFHIFDLLSQHMSTKEAVVIISKISGINKNKIYQAVCKKQC